MLDKISNLATKLFGSKTYTIKKDQPMTTTSQPGLVQKAGGRLLKGLSNAVNKIFPEKTYTFTKDEPAPSMESMPKSGLTEEEKSMKISPTPFPSATPKPREIQGVDAIVPGEQRRFNIVPEAYAQEISEDDILGRNPQVKKLQGAEYNRIRSIIYSAADEFGVDPALMEDMAFAESTLNPRAQSTISTAGGLFQYIDSSWDMMRRELGLPPDASKYDPEANARATALAISKGRIGWWDASRHNWGRFHGNN